MWIAGQMLEVVLAKPQTEKKFDAANPYNAIPHHNYIPHPGYGAFPMNPFAPLTAGYGAAAAAAAGFQQVFSAEVFIVDSSLCH